MQLVTRTWAAGMFHKSREEIGARDKSCAMSVSDDREECNPRTTAQKPQMLPSRLRWDISPAYEKVMTEYLPRGMVADQV
jgi:hypothetical protein